MLNGCRVLDLTTERGLLCGQILGDLGADVIKIEPPGGSATRSLKPFFADEPGPERSVYWWAYNRNKRGVTLDLARDEGPRPERGYLLGGGTPRAESGGQLPHALGRMPQRILQCNNSRMKNKKGRPESRPSCSPFECP